MGAFLLLLAVLLSLLTTYSVATGHAELAVDFPQLLIVVVLVAILARAGWLLRSGVRLRWTALLLFVGIAAVTLSSAFTWVDYQLATRDTSKAPDDPYKVWSTRGLVLGGTENDWDGTQNSISSIRRAFEHGARGVEVDVFFDPQMGHFVVSHDFPYNLKDGKLLLLGELLEAVGQSGMFWLDWKKLRHLEPEDFQRALDELSRLTAAGDLRQRFYVEGEDPFRIRRAARSGFLTILDTHPLPDSNFLTPFVTSLYKALFYYGQHTVMGIESGTPERPIHGPRSSRILKNVPLFVYHVPNNPAQMQAIAMQENVRVILPKDQTLDLFGYQPQR